MRKFYSMLLAMLTVCTLAQAQVTFDFTGEDAYSLFGFTGFSTNESNEGDFNEATSLTSGPVTITVSPSEGHTANRMWYGSLRMYGGTLTITSSDKLISSIEFELNASKWNEGNSSEVGTMEVGKWTGNSSTVVISIAGNTQIKKMIVSLGENGEGPGEEPVVPTPKEGTGDGTQANPYNCVAASSVASSLESGQVTEKEYYVKGIISQIKYEFSVQYGTAIFFISDDGTKDNQFQVYNTYYLGNRAWVADDMQIKLGDEVIVCGKLTNYNGTPETASRQNYLYSLNGITDGGVGPDPQPVTITEVTCAHAVELTNALADGATSTDTYAVTGYITEVVGNVSRNQQTFWMADTKDGGKVFEAYWANLPEGVSEFKVGCKVKIIGQLVKYVKDDVVTPEIKNPYVIILEDGGNTPEPRPEMGEWESTVYTPLVVDHALKLAAELKADEKSPQNVFVKGIVSEITEVNTQYGNATYYISDDGTTDQQLLVYRGRGVNGARFEAEDALAVGDHVIVCGQIVNFKGNTLEFTTGSSILSLKPAAVSVVKADAAEGDIYTIAGQRVPAITRHGLYIVGGKKVVK